MKKRVWTPLLLMALTASLAVGCGNAQETAGGGEEEVKQETQEAAPEETATVEPECIHEWVEATYAAPKTCKLCGETEGEPKQSYFDEHGVNVPDAPVACTVDCLIYDHENAEGYQEMGQSVYKQIDCYAEPADEDGYQRIHLTVTASDMAYYNAEQNMTAYGTLGTGIYDWYTGRKLPMHATDGDDVQEYAVTLDIDGVSYEVSYSKSVQWEYGEWVYDEAGNWTEDLTATLEYTFRIPEGYDGLVYAAIPQREYSEIDTETVEGLEEAIYAFDEGEYPEDTQFFRINRTEIPVREAEADTEDADETETAE